MSPRRFLLFDEVERPDWRPLRASADVSTVVLPDELDLFGAPDRCQNVKVSAAVEFVTSCSGRYDFVLAERASAFLWHCLFRLADDRTPFVIVPRFNCVHARDAYALFLSSQLADARDVLFCGSRAASRAFGMYGFQCSSRFLPGIELETFRPLPARRPEIREELGARAGRDLLLYVGRMTDDKNVLELLEAVRIVRESRDVELVLCFRFPREEYLARCREAAVSMGGVRFIQDPDSRMIVRWYNAADLFVSAAVSEFETFGRAPVEAMACGTPPVVPAYDGFRDTVTGEAGFLVPTTKRGLRTWPDVRLLADTILGALEDRPGLKTRAHASVACASRFDTGRSVRSMLCELERRDMGARRATRRNERVSLHGYPEPIAEVWAALEGVCLRDLVMDLVSSGSVPVRPTDDSVSRMYASWFAHY